jgi:uncharacterized protein
MYNTTIPFIIDNLTAVSKFLKKAEAQVEAKKFDKSVVLGLRIYPDMLNLTKQVQIMTDHAKGCGARLSGTLVPSFPDEEKTFDELQARIAKTIDYLKSLDAKLFEGTATREVTLKVGGNDVTMPGQKYFTSTFLPNFFFHMTTAYNILRGVGIELGKRDFLGRA